MTNLSTIGPTLIVFKDHHHILVYGFIIIVGLLEGPFLSLVLGILLRVGLFNVFPVYASLMTGDLLGDIIWYYVGYHYGRSIIKGRIGKWFSITEEKIITVENLFNTHTKKILFTSKLTNGLGLAIPILTTAGIAKVPFRSFITINIIGQMLWTGMLLIVGYFFGEAILKFSSITGKIFFLVGVVVIIFILFRLFKKNYKKVIEL